MTNLLTPTTVRSRLSISRAVGGAFDLGLLEALLDRRHSAAAVFDCLYRFHGRGLDVVGHRLHDVGAGEGVEGRHHVGLVGDHLLGAQRQPRGFLGREGDGLVVGGGVQGRCTAQDRTQALQGDSDEVDLGLLCGQLHAGGAHGTCTWLCGAS
jgi:hypothetical protein